MVVAGSGAGGRARKEAAEELWWPASARVVGASGARGCRRWTRESGEALIGGERSRGFWIGDAHTDSMGIDPDVGGDKRSGGGSYEDP